MSLIDAPSYEVSSQTEICPENVPTINHLDIICCISLYFSMRSCYEWLDFVLESMAMDTLIAPRPVLNFDTSLHCGICLVVRLSIDSFVNLFVPPPGRATHPMSHRHCCNEGCTKFRWTFNDDSFHREAQRRFNEHLGMTWQIKAPRDDTLMLSSLCQIAINSQLLPSLHIFMAVSGNMFLILLCSKRGFRPRQYWG